MECGRWALAAVTFDSAHRRQGRQAEDMAVRGPGPVRRFVPSEHDSAVERWTSNRRLYLDNLKVILIAAIIVGHAVLGYSEFDWWSYADVREVTLSPVVVAVLLVAAVPFGMVVIPLLFLVAGLLTPPSGAARGAALVDRVHHHPGYAPPAESVPRPWPGRLVALVSYGRRHSAGCSGKSAGWDERRRPNPIFLCVRAYAHRRPGRRPSTVIGPRAHRRQPSRGR